MNYLGIDPGKKGGWAIIDTSGTVIEAAQLDLANLSGLADAIRQADVIGLERAQGAPDQAHQFEYGRGFGKIEGLIAAIKGDDGLAGVNYFAPVFWKARLGISADKVQAVRQALKLLPELVFFANRIGNIPDGLAEAALIARSMLNEDTMADLKKNAEKRARSKMRKRFAYRD